MGRSVGLNKGKLTVKSLRLEQSTKWRAWNHSEKEWQDAPEVHTVLLSRSEEVEKFRKAAHFWKGQVPPLTAPRRHWHTIPSPSLYAFSSSQHDKLKVEGTTGGPYEWASADADAGADAK